MIQKDSVIDIDLHKLEEEWLDQATRMMNACKRLARAKKKHSEAKANQDLVHAKCDLRIRKSPRKYGIAKVTEPAIKNTILTLQEFQTAQQQVIDAKYLVDNIEALVNALEHRKRALENEVTLWSQGYFSTPRLKSGTSDEVKDKMRNGMTKKLHALGER